MNDPRAWKEEREKGRRKGRREIGRREEKEIGMEVRKEKR
jgi:hypothetical protein